MPLHVRSNYYSIITPTVSSCMCLVKFTNRCSRQVARAHCEFNKVGLTSVSKADGQAEQGAAQKRKENKYLTFGTPYVIIII